MIIRDKVFLSDGLAWTVEVSNYGDKNDWIANAVCPNQECHVVLNFSGGRKESECIKCHKTYSIKVDYDQLRSEVDLKYQGSKFWMADVINLDLLPTKLSTEDSDEQYWVQTRLGQRNGKRTAAIFIGEKKTNQTKKDFTQLMVDLDDEQVRFDKGNMHPIKLLSKINVEFNSNVVTIISRKKGDPHGK